MNHTRLLVPLLALAVAGCGSARRGLPFVGEQTPPTAKIALGERVFAANCTMCHPGGTSGIGPALNNKPLPGWAIKLQVRNGLGAMPAFSDEEISSDELDAIVHYVVWLRRLEPHP